MHLTTPKYAPPTVLVYHHHAGDVAAVSVHLEIGAGTGGARGPQQQQTAAVAAHLEVGATAAAGGLQTAADGWLAVLCNGRKGLWNQATLEVCVCVRACEGSVYAVVCVALHMLTMHACTARCMHIWYTCGCGVWYSRLSRQQVTTGRQL